MVWLALIVNVMQGAGAWTERICAHLPLAGSGEPVEERTGQPIGPAFDPKRTAEPGRDRL
jgi:hypothetical protein